MKIQAIQKQNYCSNINNSKRIKINANITSFKGDYNQVMRNILSKDLRSRADVAGAISDLYCALTKEAGIIRTSVQPLLSEWFACKGTYLIEELCKPTAKVPSNLRDIIFKSQDENLPVIKQNGDSLLYIRNTGKHGFWNSIFENESAPNDITVVFSAKDGSFEVGTNKDGKLVTEQTWYSGSWIKNTYNMFFGDRIKHKEGDASGTVIWPGV